MSSSVSGSRSSSVSQQPYPYYQDAVRIYVQQMGCGGSLEEGDVSSGAMTSSTSSIEQGPSGPSRRFSVDPQLTSFGILRNLIGRAFDMKGDFAISYRAFDDFGAETYLPLVSDWDLSAAFLSASDPDLQLMIEPKNIPLDVDVEDEPWDIVASTEVISDASQRALKFKGASTSGPSTSTYPNHNQNFHQRNNLKRQDQGQGSQGQNGNTNFGFPASVQGSKVLSAMTQLGGAVNQYPITLNSKINTAGIFNTMEKWVQKAKTFVEDISVVTTRPPLSDVEFRNYLDPGGVLCRPRELRYACYHGGVEPGLRKVVWKHLLNIYPDGLSGNARIDYVKNKAKDYYELRDLWKTAVQNGQVSEDILVVSNMVRKDVLRTDRHLQFYAGHDDNQNIGLLFNILTTYALNHPSVGYCQGMSDLASPLLCTMGDEAQAYICFCSLMDRLKPNFNCDGLAMSLKFSHLSEALAFYDGAFWAYLKTIGADDLLFCYRWLLLEMKREFAFEDALRMMEVLWASLPYKPQDVSLFEVKFTLSNANSIPIPVPILTSSYSRVCAIRRSSTSIGAAELRGRRLSRKPKANPLSLDENSLSSMSSISTTNSYRPHTKPFYSLDETTEILTSADFTPSPFEIYSFKPNAEETPPAEPRMVKNLREFWAIGKKGGSEDSPDSPFSSKSSTMSNFESVIQQMQGPDGDLNGQVFFDDADNNDSPLTMSTHSLGVENPATHQRKRHSSTSSAKVRASTSTSTSISAVTSTATPTPTLNLKNEKSEPIPGDNTDPERRSQISAADSEHDSGHCYGDSLELFENSMQEPEFSAAGGGAPQTRHLQVKMPSPDVLGGGNPFLMFLSLTLLLQHRDHIIRNRMDYNETAMYFDKMIRKHNVGRVLAHARMLYSEYLKQNVTRA